MRRTVFTGDFSPPETEAGSHIWEWFWEATGGRQAGMAGWCAVSWSEFIAWSTASGAIVRRQEWNILRQMDRAFLEASMIERKPGQPTGYEQPVTPESFDAVFG